MSFLQFVLGMDRYCHVNMSPIKATCDTHTHTHTHKFLILDIDNILMIYSIKLGAKVHEQQNPILILMHEMSRHPLQQLVQRTSLHSCTNVVNTDTCVKSEAGCKHYILPIFTLPGGVRVHFWYTSFLEDRETLPLSC